MTKHPLRVWDRSRTEKDWTCPRARYWNYEWDGTGVASATTALELYMGTTVHDALAAIAAHQVKGTVDIDAIAQATQKQMFDSLMAESAGESDWEARQFANEQAALVEGMVRGFFRYSWPQIMAQYPIIVAIEKEMEYQHNGFVFMSRPDLVVADADGNKVYLEYKTTSNKDESWINSWNTAVQLHSTIRAIENDLGEKVLGVVVHGLYKGFKSYGKQSSPFCYLYQREAHPPFIPQAEVLYEYKAGFKRRPTWEAEGGVKKWVENMPDMVLANQFPCTPMIFVHDALVDDFFAQRIAREQEVKLALEVMENTEPDMRKSIMDIAFPQKFSSCDPPRGYPCLFKLLCFGNPDQNPLEAGYQRRVSHHELELKMHKKLGYGM